MNNIVQAAAKERAARIALKEALIATGKVKVKTITKKDRTRFARLRAKRIREGYYRKPPTDLYERDVDLLGRKDKVSS